MHANTQSTQSTPATPFKLPARLHSLAAMASLLEKLDRLPRSASAGQYREVATRVSALLEVAEPDAYLQALLDAAPATAELYENLNYAVAGLCRSPLAGAAQAELEAASALAAARNLYS